MNLLDIASSIVERAMALSIGQRYVVSLWFGLTDLNRLLWRYKTSN
ncbi:MAG TPA: hypothetical protein VF020_15770 [Chthoniobacterales bacterium]